MRWSLRFLLNQIILEFCDLPCWSMESCGLENSLLERQKALGLPGNFLSSKSYIPFSLAAALQGCWNCLGMLLVSGLCYVLDVYSTSWTGARHLLTSVISA